MRTMHESERSSISLLTIVGIVAQLFHHIKYLRNAPTTVDRCVKTVTESRPKAKKLENETRHIMYDCQSEI